VLFVFYFLNTHDTLVLISFFHWAIFLKQFFHVSSIHGGFDTGKHKRKQHLIFRFTNHDVMTTAASTAASTTVSTTVSTAASTTVSTTVSTSDYDVVGESKPKCKQHFWYYFFLLKKKRGGK
jgi:hypothetical protein